MVPTISNIVRTSLSKGIFPQSLKISHIRPKLKKTDLDKELFTNYRPIANIAFMSKVIQKTVALQVLAYLNDNQLLPSFQSAYRQHHSTETALLKVTNDILMTIDSRRDRILILLDLSAAFDTLDHNILIKRLNSYFGLSGSVLQWFSSYIKDRGQSVVIGDVISSPQKLDYGIPQGSIVGPLLFTLYTAPLQQVILRHNFECMFYADDTQLYIAVNRKDPSPAYEALRKKALSTLLN